VSLVPLLQALQCVFRVLPEHLLLLLEVSHVCHVPWDLLQRKEVPVAHNAKILLVDKFAVPDLIREVMENAFHVL
jgi:hypothetical protein